MRWSSVLLVLGTLTVACSRTLSGAGDSCESVGGTCVLGSAACARQAASSAQDCNPMVSPGGAVCCLELGDGGVPDGEATGAPDGSPGDT
jgi:hypothetical protein